MKFNLADVFETVADAVPERVVLSYEGNQTTYAEMDRQANQVAHFFASRGIGADDKVALFLKNSPEHVQTLIATIKLRAVPVNVNYRYTDAELEYIFDNSDAAAIIVELPEHQASVARLLAKLPMVRAVF
ncbi:AMP-binding protein, partial [Gordonia sp. UBA5067]